MHCSYLLRPDVKEMFSKLIKIMILSPNEHSLINLKIISVF
jgi:hypothetical protein